MTAVEGRRATAARRWRELIAPVDGRPRPLVLWWFPALAALATAVLVALRLSGTSSGVYWRSFGTGDDPRLIAGEPQLIRSDEWLVNQGWTVSQRDWGFPAVNPTFPGGMDATSVQELPNLDWPTLFRPHEWGYLLAGLDVGVAWFWWLPTLALVVAAYLLVIQLVPTRPVTAALVSLAVPFAPILAWQWGPNFQWPMALAMLVPAAVHWSLRDPRLAPRIAWAAVVGFVAVTAAIGLYVPVIVPCVLVAVGVAVGFLAERLGRHGLRFGEAARRLLPLVVAAVAAGGAIAAFVVTRGAAFTALGATVYPGDRHVASGGLLAADPRLLGTLGSIFAVGLDGESAASPLGPNATQAAGSPLLALALLPGLLVLAILARRREGGVDRAAIAVVVVAAVLFGYQLVPGIDAVGRVLLLDRVQPTRIWVVAVLLLPVVVGLLLRRLDRTPGRAVRVLVAGVAVAFVAGSAVWVWRSLRVADPALLDASAAWPLLLAASLAAVVLLVVPRTAVLGAAATLALFAGVGGWVNPLYVGVFDLNDTETGQAIDRVDAADPGAWVGVGGYEVMALLMEAGVRGYSGFQPYPSEEMWAQIDPDGDDEEYWNRMAHVRWQLGEGEPDVQLASSQIIVSSFDPCSRFAAEHVRYLLTDTPVPDGSCAVELDRIREGELDLRIYEVTG